MGHVGQERHIPIPEKALHNVASIMDTFESTLGELETQFEGSILIVL